MESSTHAISALTPRARGGIDDGTDTIRDAVRSQFGRLKAIWPRLAKSPELLGEIEKAVMAKAPVVTPADVVGGFDDVISMTPSSAWAPGPHEVVGCILARKATRTAGVPKTPRRTGGLTFAEWWDTLPEHERPQHETLRRMMGKVVDTVEGAASSQPRLAVPLDFSASAGTPSGDDVISWEAA